MKAGWKVVTVVAVMAVLASVALAQGPWAQPMPRPQGGGPGMGPGGPGGPMQQGWGPGWQQHPGGRGMGPGGPGGGGPGWQQQPRPPRGYLSTSPESHQLWFRQGELQNQAHGEQWRLFELLNEEPKDPEKIRAQAEKMRGIQMEMQQVQQQLQPYWATPPQPPQGPGWPGAPGGPPPGASGPPPPPPPAP